MQQANLICLMRIKYPSAQQDLAGAAESNQLYQASCTTPPCGQSIPYLGKAQAALFSSYAQVTSSNDLTASAKRIAVDRCNNWKRQPPKFGKRLAHDPVQPPARRLIVISMEFFEVAPSHKSIVPGSRDDKHSYPVICLGGIYASGKTILGLPVERIAGLRAIDLQHGYPVLTGVADNGSFLTIHKAEFIKFPLTGELTEAKQCLQIMLKSKAMNERSYYTDSYTTQFSATVTDTHHDEQGCVVTLDRTYFYPTSGGQPFDTGVIDGIPVLDVMVRKEDGAILHVLDSAPKAKEVTAVVNWQRRFDHMQQHTGQHILSQAFIRTANAQTIGFHLSDETVTIDLDCETVDEATIDAAEKLANQIVWQNHPVVVRWATLQEAQSLPLRKIPANGGEKLRLVDILDFDLTACGGTHVARTGEVGLIKIIKKESRNKKARILFCCGQRALAHHRLLNEIVHQLSTQLTTGATDLTASIARMQENDKESRRHVKRLQGQLDEFEAHRLFDEGQKLDDVTLVIHVFENDAGRARGIASRLSKMGRTVALLASTGERCHLIFSRSADTPGDMKDLLQIALEQMGSGSGGGNESFAQGAAGAADVQTVERALGHAAEQLLLNIDPSE